MIDWMRRSNSKNAQCARLMNENLSLKDHLYDLRAKLHQQEERNTELHQMLHEEGQRVTYLTKECKRLRGELEIERVFRGIEEAEF